MVDPQCWHKQINSEGFCEHCGARAAIKMPERTAVEPFTEDDRYFVLQAIERNLGYRLRDAVQHLLDNHDALAAQIESAWNYIEHGWEIEPRSYFEEKYGKDALFWACHYIWKRNPKVEPVAAQYAELRKALETIEDCLEQGNHDHGEPECPSCAGHEVARKALALTPPAAVEQLTQRIRQEVLDEIKAQMKAFEAALDTEFEDIGLDKPAQEQQRERIRREVIEECAQNLESRVNPPQCTCMTCHSWYEGARVVRSLLDKPAQEESGAN